jgi:hypothetical protein
MTDSTNRTSEKWQKVSDLIKNNSPDSFKKGKEILKSAKM